MALYVVGCCWHLIAKARKKVRHWVIEIQIGWPVRKNHDGSVIVEEIYR